MQMEKMGGGGKGGGRKWRWRRREDGFTTDAFFFEPPHFPTVEQTKRKNPPSLGKDE